MTAVYTVREVAELLRCSPMTVRRAIDAGQLPSIRLMGVVRVPALALAALTLPHDAEAATPDPSHGSATVVDGSGIGAAESSPRDDTRSDGIGKCPVAAPSSARVPDGTSTAAPQPRGA